MSMTTPTYLGGAPDDISMWIKNNIITREKTRVWWSNNPDDYDDYLIEDQLASNSLNQYGKVLSNAYRIEVGLGTKEHPLTSIEQNALYSSRYQSRLTSIMVSNNVTLIKNSAFEDCIRLSSIVIPYNITEIGSGAFRNCSSLTSMSIPESSQKIGTQAFYQCKNLSGALNFSDSLLDIQWGAFSNCSYSSVSIGSRLSSIGYQAFYWNPIECFTVDPDNQHFCSVSRCLLNKECTLLINGVNGDVIIPNTVTAINEYAFSGKDIMHIEIPDSVTQIGQRAFQACWHLKEIMIPDNVINIGDAAFNSCSSMTDISIGNHISQIAGAMFNDCNSLSAVHITDMSGWCKIKFTRSSVSYQCNPLMTAHNLFLNGQLVTDLSIPDGITEISSYAFSGCTPLRSATIPPSVKKVYSLAFENCPNLSDFYISDIGSWSSITYSNLTSTVLSSSSNLYLDNVLVTDAVIPGSVSAIGSFAFANYSHLEEVTLQSGVQTIGSGAFAKCPNLNKIVFSNTLTAILARPAGAFSNCTSLSVFDFRLAAQVPSLQSVAVFSNTPANKEIVVPDSLYDSWIAASNWSSTTNGIVSSIVRASDSSLGPL